MTSMLKPARHQKRRLRLPVLISVLLAVLTAATTIASPRPDTPETSFHFGCGVNKKSKTFQQLHSIYSQVFRDLGHGFTMQHYPELRSIELLNKGLIDGLCGTSPTHYQTSLSKHTLVATTIAQSNVQIWSTHPVTIQTASPATQGKPQIDNVDIGYVRGGIVDEVLEKYALPRLRVIKGIEQGLKMMHSNRIGAVIGFEFYLKELSTKDGIDAERFHKQTLMDLTFYPVLSSQHSAMKEVFSQTLKSTLSRYDSISDGGAKRREP